MAKRQQTIDFSDRGRQLRLLGRLRLADPPRSWRTSKSTMRAMLRELDSMIGTRDGFRVGLTVLADRLQIAPETARKAMKGLERLGLIDATTTGRTKVYSINWPAVDQATKVATPVTCHRSERAPVTSQTGDMSPVRPVTCHRSTLEPFTESLPAAAGWDAISDELQAAGVHQVEDTVAAAIAVRMEPGEVRQLIADFQANRGRLASPGAISARIRSGSWPASGVVTAADQAANREAAERRRKEQAEGNQAAAAAAAASRQQIADLEARFGRHLDEMSTDDRDRLARSVFVDRFAWERYKRRKGGRVELLEALSRNLDAVP